MERTDRTGLRLDSPHDATRTCVGCRQTDSRSALLRVVDGTDPRRVGTPGVALVPDLRRSLPGRGAWLHPTVDCLGLAIRRRAFGRALRLSAAPDLAAVTAYVEGHEQTDRPSMGTESGFDADEHPMSTQ